MEYQTHDDPPFVEETPQFSALRKARTDMVADKFSKSAAEQAFSLLKEIMRIRQGNTDLSIFIERINTNIDESQKISNIIANIAHDKEWSNNTVKAKFQTFKYLLSTISISDNFISRLAYKSKLPHGTFDIKGVIGRRFASLPEDNVLRKRIEGWIDIIRRNSKNRAATSVRSIISFYVNQCLPKLNITLNEWDIYNIRINQAIVDDICSSNPRQHGWLSILCVHILGIEFKYSNKLSKPKDGPVDYTSGDKHKIPANELDIIYSKACETSVLDHLTFLLFITTGMRVGGLVKIKIQHVCEITGNDIRVFKSGRTLEKGNKWFEFAINETVAELIEKWVRTERRGSTDYLFPSTSSSSSHTSTNTIRARFKRLCEQAGLEGAHLHVHALRHSYAHILLRCGNDVTTISKLLNHANTQVTEQFYLKESIAEVVDRANIPWLDTSQKPENVIPKFLSKKDKKEKDRPSNRHKRMELLQGLDFSRKKTENLTVV